MKIYGAEKAEECVIKCKNCGFHILVMHVAIDFMNVMNPMHLSYCPICGKNLWTAKDIHDHMVDLEYKIMCEEYND